MKQEVSWLRSSRSAGFEAGDQLVMKFVIKLFKIRKQNGLNKIYFCKVQWVAII